MPRLNRAIAKEQLAGLFPALPHAYFAPGDPAGAGFKKGYAGVAVYSKVAAKSATPGLGDGEHDGAGRLLTCEFGWGTLLNVYAPNS